MKFGKTLQQEILPEWRKYYIPYSDLKKEIKVVRLAMLTAEQEERGESSMPLSLRSLKNVPDATASLDNLRKVHSDGSIDGSKPEWMEKEDALVQKAVHFAYVTNEFYLRKVDEYEKHLQILASQLRLLKRSREQSRVLYMTNKRKVERALVSFMTDLDRLKGFARINFNALGKLFKKFDKQLRTDRGYDTLSHLRKSLGYRLHAEVDTLIENCTALYGTEILQDVRETGEDISFSVNSGVTDASSSDSYSISKALHKTTSARSMNSIHTENELRDVITNAAMRSRVSRRKRPSNEPANPVELKDEWMNSVFSRMMKKREAVTKWVPFWVGFTACGLLLLTAFLWVNVSLNVQAASRDEIILFVPAFRMLLLPIILMLCFVFNRYIWKQYNINDRVIFQTDPNTRLTVIQMLVVQLISFFIMIAFANLVFASLIGQLHTGDDGQAMVSTMLVIFLLVLVMPMPRMYHKSRMYIYRISWRTAMAPFYYVEFVENWLADQWTSLPRALVDGARVSCYYANNFWDSIRSSHCFTGDDSKQFYVVPIMSAYPYWVRFLQCLRRFRDHPNDYAHLWNAGKYSFGLLIVAFSTASKTKGGADWGFNTWIGVSIVGTCYFSYWDVMQDWGLTLFSYHHFRHSKHWPLREPSKMLYPRWWYYAAIVTDITIRLGWVFTMSPHYFGIKFSQEILTTVLSILGVIRRGVWNIFRVENEHVSNAGKFRAELDIDLPYSEEDVKKEIETFLSACRDVDKEEAEKLEVADKLDAEDGGAFSVSKQGKECDESTPLLLGIETDLSIV